MTQSAELWFHGEAVIDLDATADRLRGLLGSNIQSQEMEGGRMFAHLDHPVEYEGGEKGPAITAVMPQPSVQAESCQAEIQQSWRCADAQELVEKGQQAMLVLEMLTRPLGPALRLKLFHATLEAALQECDAPAVVFRSSQQVIARADYLEDLALEAMQRAGALNVRMFQVNGEEGASTLMDTYGMEALDRHDLQCHYKDLEPQDVARALFNTSYYLIDEGAVIEDGNTINGLEEGQTWSCRFQKSLAQPQRRILDLDPGDPHAAGEREREDDAVG